MSVSSYSVSGASDETDPDTWLLDDRDLLGFEFLVSWFTHFILLLEVQPQLEAYRHLGERTRHLGVHNPFSSSHPLDVAWSKAALITRESVTH